MRASAQPATLVVGLGLALGCAAEPRPSPSPSPPREAAHQHAGGMPHRFENAAQWASSFDDPARDAWQRPDDVLAELALRPGLAIADVGAGTGYFTVRLARAVPDGQIIATDIEPDMVRYVVDRAKREGLGNVTGVLAGAADPKLPPASLDRILIVDVWHHLADRVRYAAGLAAALRAGGRVAIVDFTMTAAHGPPPRHRLTPEAIMADLRAVGLDASVSPVQLPEQYIVVGVRP